MIGGISNLLVFALVGLWHGPEKHYLFWGLYYGAIIAVSDAIAPLFAGFKRIPEDSAGGRALYVFRIIRTFMIMVFAGYFDVIDTVSIGLKCFVNTVAHFDFARGAAMIVKLFKGGITSVEAMVTASLALIMLITNSVYKERGRLPLRRFKTARYYVRWGICFTLMLVLLYSFTVSSGVRGFMYAAF